MIRIVHPVSGSGFLPIPDPGSRGQKDTGSRIWIRNTGCKLLAVVFPKRCSEGWYGTSLQFLSVPQIWEEYHFIWKTTYIYIKIVIGLRCVRINVYPLIYLIITRLTANAEVATVLGSIPASSDTVESERRQMKQCWIQSICRKEKKCTITRSLWIINPGVCLAWILWPSYSLKYLQDIPTNACTSNKIYLFSVKKVVEPNWFCDTCCSPWTWPSASTSVRRREAAAWNSSPTVGMGLSPTVVVG